MGEVLLEARGLSRRFGHFVAVEGVSLALVRGELHALIGPNGAGKTTLVDMLSGALRAEAGGEVRVLGRDVTRFPPWRVARCGLGRSFQRAQLFRDMSAVENVRLSVRGRYFGKIFGRDFSWGFGGFGDFGMGDGGREALEAALEALRDVGLESRADDLVKTFSHGERRSLELAMACAGGAEVILLDEPLAGLGAGESRAMSERIRALTRGRAVLMIEHDLDVVFRLADRVTVLVSGCVIASGLPREVQEDSRVQEAYLPHQDSDDLDNLDTGGVA
ncbi:MAG: ABC transporter ATP-binding protein [Alphaproteobacteria bacterium]